MCDHNLCEYSFKNVMQSACDHDEIHFYGHYSANHDLRVYFYERIREVSHKKTYG